MDRLLSEFDSFILEVLVCCLSTALAVRRSTATSEGATVPVEGPISSLGSPLNGLIHSVSIKSTSDCTACSFFVIRDDFKSWWLKPGGLISVNSRGCFRQVLLYSTVR